MRGASSRRFTVSPASISDFFGGLFLCLFVSVWFVFRFRDLFSSFANTNDRRSCHGAHGMGEKNGSVCWVLFFGVWFCFCWLCCLVVVLCLFCLAVNLACFTKTRVCSSCFGSTNSGMRLFTKTQICLSCFGSTNLGHPASFKSSDGHVNLDVWLWFAFPPFILSFHRPCAPRRPRWSLSHYFGRDPPHSMHLANEFGLTALASVSSSRPPQFGICCCRCFV